MDLKCILSAAILLKNYRKFYTQSIVFRGSNAIRKYAYVYLKLLLTRIYLLINEAGNRSVACSKCGSEPTA